MPLQQEKDNQLETLQEDCYFIYHLLSGGLEKQDQRRMRDILVIYSQYITGMSTPNSS